MKTEPGTEAELVVKEEDKDKDRDKEREKEKEKEREREKDRATRGSATVKEERDRAGTSSSHLEENVAERCAVVGGPKRKEVEQLKILRAELKYVL